MNLSGKLWQSPSLHDQIERSIKQGAYIVFKSRQRLLVERNFFPLDENKELFRFATALRPLLLSKTGWEPLMIAKIVDGHIVIPLVEQDGADWTPSRSKAVDEVVESLRKVGEISVSLLSAEARTEAIETIANTFPKREGVHVTSFRLIEAVKTLAPEDNEAPEIEVMLPGSQPAPLKLPDHAQLVGFHNSRVPETILVNGGMTGLDMSKGFLILDGFSVIIADESDLAQYKIGDFVHAECVEISEVRMRRYQLIPGGRIKPGLGDQSLF